MSQPLRFVSWTAVSSLPQARKVSLQDQQKLNQEHIARWGGVEVAHLEVPGESRSLILFEEACRRIPAYARLGELLAARAFDVLIYLDRSRLGRKASLSMAIVELCAQAGVSVYETENPPSSLEDLQGKVSFDDRLLGAFKSVSAQREVDVLQERKRRGMIGRARQGLPPGKPRFGYAWEQFGPRREDRRIVTVPEQIETVLYLYELYVERGLGIPSITAALEEAGKTTPVGGSRWHAATVYNLILSCWIYAGFVEYNRRSKTGLPFGRFPAIWPAVISEERAAEVEAERKRRSTTKRSLHNRRYSRVLVCGACGAQMVVAGTKPSRQTGETLVYYRCASQCHGSYIGERVLDVELGQELTAIAEGGIEGYLNDETGTAALQAKLDAEVEKLDGQEGENAEERLRLARLVVRGSLSEEDYETLLEEIEKRGERILAQRGEIQRRRLELQEQAGRAVRLADVAAMGPEILQNEDVRGVNRWLRKHVRLYVAGNHVALVEWV